MLPPNALRLRLPRLVSLVLFTFCFFSFWSTALGQSQQTLSAAVAAEEDEELAGPAAWQAKASSSGAEEFPDSAADVTGTAAANLTPVGAFYRQKRQENFQAQLQPLPRGPPSAHSVPAAPKRPGKLLVGSISFAAAAAFALLWYAISHLQEGQDVAQGRPRRGRRRGAAARAGRAEVPAGRAAAEGPAGVFDAFASSRRPTLTRKQQTRRPTITIAKQQEETQRTGFRATQLLVAHAAAAEAAATQAREVAMHARSIAEEKALAARIAAEEAAAAETAATEAAMAAESKIAEFAAAKAAALKAAGEEADGVKSRAGRAAAAVAALADAAEVHSVSRRKAAGLEGDGKRAEAEDAAATLQPKRFQAPEELQKRLEEVRSSLECVPRITSLMVESTARDVASRLQQQLAAADALLEAGEAAASEEAAAETWKRLEATVNDLAEDLVCVMDIAAEVAEDSVRVLPGKFHLGSWASSIRFLGRQHEYLKAVSLTLESLQRQHEILLRRANAGLQHLKQAVARKPRDREGVERVAEDAQFVMRTTTLLMKGVERREALLGDAVDTATAFYVTSRSERHRWMNVELQMAVDILRAVFQAWPNRPTEEGKDKLDSIAKDIEAVQNGLAAHAELYEAVQESDSPGKLRKSNADAQHLEKKLDKTISRIWRHIEQLPPLKYMFPFGDHSLQTMTLSVALDSAEAFSVDQQAANERISSLHSTLTENFPTFSSPEGKWEHQVPRAVVETVYKDALSLNALIKRLSGSMRRYVQRTEQHSLLGRGTPTEELVRAKAAAEETVELAVEMEGAVYEASQLEYELTLLSLLESDLQEAVSVVAQSPPEALLQGTPQAERIQLATLGCTRALKAVQKARDIAEVAEFAAKARHNANELFMAVYEHVRGIDSQGAAAARDMDAEQPTADTQTVYKDQQKKGTAETQEDAEALEPELQMQPDAGLHAEQTLQLEETTEAEAAPEAGEAVEDDAESQLDTAA